MDVLFAYLDESTERCNTIPERIEGVAGQGIQNNIHPSILGHSHDSLSEAGISAVEYVIVGDTIRFHEI